MNWSAIVSSLTSPRSIINAVSIFVLTYGAVTLLHLPHAWMIGIAVVIGNQIGLHQTAPGA
jgi:hypothetical protein